MTKQMIIFLLCMFSITTIHSQEKSRYKCAYEITALRDTVSPVVYHKDTYIVQINDNITKGFYYHNYYSDSLKTANYALYSQIRMETLRKAKDLRTQADPKVGEKTIGQFYPSKLFMSTLYKDYEMNEIRITDEISLFDKFVFTDQLKPQDWEIESDTLTILGYHSQKATCNYRGRNWIAWFTNEIPLSEGPWKFYGLPGLITKIADDKEHYSFTLTGFQEVVEPIDTRISPKTEKIERKKFIKSMMDGQIQQNIAALAAEVIGLSNTGGNASSVNRRGYDYIERDYK